MTKREIIIGKTYHMQITKEYLARLVKENGAKEILDDYEGTTEEAVEAILSSPRETFTVGVCDNADEKGWCLGHDKEDT